MCSTKEINKLHILYIYIYIYIMKVLVAQSCLTLCDPMDCSPPGSSVHGILQVRRLEWVAIPFSRGFSWPKDWTWVLHSAGRLFTDWATREDLFIYSFIYKPHGNHEPKIYNRCTHTKDKKKNKTLKIVIKPQRENQKKLQNN